MKEFLKVLLPLALVLLMIIPSSATEEQAEPIYVYARSESSPTDDTFDSFELPHDATEITSEEKPEVTGAHFSQTISRDGTDYLRIITDGKSQSISARFSTGSRDEDEDLTFSGGSLVMGIYIQGTEKEDSISLVTAEITVTDGKTELTCKASLRESRSSVIYVDLSDAPKDFVPERVTATISSDSDTMSSVILSFPVTTDTEDFRLQKSGGILWLSELSGSIRTDGEKAILSTDTEDVSVLMIPAAYPEKRSDELRRSYLAVSCTEGDGTVTASSDTGSTASSVQHTLSSANEAALLRVTHTEGDPIRLTFRSGGKNKLVLDGLSFYATEETDRSSRGSLSSLSVTDGRLEASGKVSGDVVGEYPKSKLGLYMVQASGGTPELIKKIDITSRFSITAETDELPYASSDCLFYVSVIDGDENELLRISDPRFPSASAGKIPTESDFGLYGANPISVYESGASHILVDVDLSKLIVSASQSSTTVSRGKYIFGISSDYIRELDSGMDFYRSSGVSVYMRLVCKSFMISDVDGEWLTYHASHSNEVVLRQSSSEAMNMYMAAVSFLCQRYQNISSLVISSGANDPSLTGIRSDSPYDSAANTAILMRLGYNAASPIIPDVTVSVPLVDTDSSDSAEIFIALLSERLASVGTIPWSILYTTDEDAPSSQIENIINTCRLNGTSYPAFTSVIWRTRDTDGDVTASYKNFCDSCSGTSVKLAFLSVGKGENHLDSEGYSLLKRAMLKGDDILVTDTPVTFDQVYGSVVKGVFTLWDFRDSYSPEGWTAGYGISTLISSVEKGTASAGDRVLRCITEGSKESPAGIILCSPDSPLNLSDSPLVEFVFSCENAEDSRISFVFASGASRAEYSFSDAEVYASDGKCRAVCDLSGFTKKSSVAYVGIIIYSDTPTTFELTRVNVISRTATEDEIEEGLYERSKPEDSSREHLRRSTVIIISAAAVLLVSFRIGAVLNKKDVRHKEAAKQRTASKKRRL